MITALLLALGALLLFLSLAGPRSPRRATARAPRASDSIDDCLSRDRGIISMTKKSASLSSRLSRRSTANARLRTTFGIVNSLTTFDPGVHQTFRNTAVAIIHEHQARRSEGCWTGLYAHAQSILRREMGTARDTVCLRLADTVRCLCLRIVLAQVFSGVDPQAPSRQTVLQVTRIINWEWIESKRYSVAEDDEDDARLGTASPELRNALEELVREMASTMTEDKNKFAEPGEITRHGHSESCKLCNEKHRLAASMVAMPAEQILGLLMPPYETLWRVVLLTFVTAYHCQLREDTVSRVAGVPGCLGDKTLETEALTVADEGLRLYPSNKRIYRALPLDTAAAPGLGRGLESVDIEGWQRDPAVWGLSALEFRPERFDTGKLTQLQRRAYLPFGIAPHKCPADQRFGTRTVTMLVVVLGRELGPHVAAVKFHDHELDRGGDEGDEAGDGGMAVLPTGRGDMEMWEAVLKREGGGDLSFEQDGLAM